MENTIKYIVECDSIYGIIALFIFFLGIALIVLITLPYLYKIVCKLCNTLKSYKDVQSKTEIEDTSFEIEMHR